MYVLKPYYGDTFSNMPASIFDGWIAINIGELPKAEAVRFIVGIGEAIDNNGVWLCVEYFSDARV